MADRLSTEDFFSKNDLEELGIKFYDTEEEALSNKPQIIYTDLAKDRGYYFHPSMGKKLDKKAYFILVPRDISKEDLKSLLSHERSHASLGHGAITNRYNYIKNELEAILYTERRKGTGRWSDHYKQYFVRNLLMLPTPRERKLCVLEAADRFGYNGAVPWPYDTTKGTVLGWIPMWALRDEDKFNSWMEDLVEDDSEFVARKSRKRRKNKR